MRSDRTFSFPVSVIVKARRMGISSSDLNHMIRKSARITHQKGNRRFHDYLFNVEGDRVLSLEKLTSTEAHKEELPQPIKEFYQCDVCFDSGKMIVFDPCDYCIGAGCYSCDGGLVKKKVTCVCRLSTHRF